LSKIKHVLKEEVGLDLNISKISVLPRVSRILSHTRWIGGSLVSKGEGNGEGVDTTLVSNTLRYISLSNVPGHLWLL